MDQCFPICSDLIVRKDSRDASNLITLVGATFKRTTALVEDKVLSGSIMTLLFGALAGRLVAIVGAKARNGGDNSEVSNRNRDISGSNNSSNNVLVTVIVVVEVAVGV